MRRVWAEREHRDHVAPTPPVATRAPDPERGEHASLLDIQSRAGNQATNALLLAGAQPKLSVGSPDDPSEREADAVASRVAAPISGATSGPPDPTLAHDRATAAPTVRRRSAMAHEDSRVDSETESLLQGARGKGRPLDGGTRQAMEGALGTDLGDVRVHTGSSATNLNTRLGAEAFTLGSDVFFRGPTPDAQAPAGAELLAHELTHVVQQRGAPSSGGIQRKPTKRPSATKGSKQEQLATELESFADDEDRAELDRVSAELHTLDSGYYLRLVLSIVNKHRSNDKYRRQFSIAMPETARWPVFDLAWKSKDDEGVAFMAKTAWDTDEAGTKAIARTDAAYFIDQFLIRGLRAQDADRGLLQKLIEEKTFLEELRVLAPKGFERLVKAVPVLKLVEGVEAEMAKEALDAKGGDGQLLDMDAAVAKLFTAFVQNKGMEVAYSGSKVDNSDVILSGRTKASDEARKPTKKALGKNMPKKLSTACHQLLNVFHTVLKSYPGIETLDVKPGDEPMAVLTKPLRELPGGLIPKTYTGNVFDEAGKSTGQVFFSGNRDKRPNSHSWLIANGVAYDPVLGTRGAAVDDAIGGRFIFDDGDSVATEVGGKGRVLTRDPKLKPSGKHNITAGWRLTTP